MNRHLKHGLISLLLLGCQVVVNRFLTLDEITPDLLAIWIVYLALKQGQLPATVWGFSIGVALDLITGDFVGLSSLAKTILGFIAGYFYNENKTRLVLGSYRFLLIILVSTFFQNLVYFALFTQGSDISLLGSLFQYGVTTTLYTAAFSLLPIFVFSRQSAAPNV